MEKLRLEINCMQTKNKTICSKNLTFNYKRNSIHTTTPLPDFNGF